MKTINLIYAPKTRAYKKGLRVEHSSTKQDQLRHYIAQLRNERAAAMQDQLDQWAKEKANARAQAKTIKPRVATAQEVASTLAKARLELTNTRNAIALVDSYANVKPPKWDIDPRSAYDLAIWFAHIAIKRYHAHNDHIASARALYDASRKAATAYFTSAPVIDTNTIVYDLYNTAYISLRSTLNKYQLSLEHGNNIQFYRTYPTHIAHKRNGEIKYNKDGSIKWNTLMQEVCNSVRTYINQQSNKHGDSGHITDISIYANANDNNDLFITDCMNIEDNTLSPFENALYTSMVDNIKKAIDTSDYKNKVNMIRVFDPLLQDQSVTAIAWTLNVSETTVRRAKDNLSEILSAQLKKDIVRVKAKGRTRYAYTCDHKAQATATDTTVSIADLMSENI